jgi:hypothetical protein
MPNPTRTWTIVINQAFSSSSDQAVQFREMFLAVWNLFIAAGWTPTRSSNGTTAGAGNNITTTGDVVLGTANFGTRVLTLSPTWGVLRSPAGWLSSGGLIEILFVVNNTDPDTTPQTAPIVCCSGTYSGGDINTLPSFTGVETAVLTSGDDIIPWTTVQTGRYATWRSSRGDVKFGVKVEGTAQWRHFQLITSQVTGDGGGQGNNRFGMFAFSSAGANVLTRANLSNAGNWAGFDTGGAFTDSPLLDTSIASGTASWTNGLDFTGETISVPFDMFANFATRGRYLGTVVDITACPLIAFGIVDDAETSQVQRRVATGGGVWIYVPTADLPLI